MHRSRPEFAGTKNKSPDGTRLFWRLGILYKSRTMSIFTREGQVEGTTWNESHEGARTLFAVIYDIVLRKNCLKMQAYHVLKHKEKIIKFYEPWVLQPLVFGGWGNTSII